MKDYETLVEGKIPRLHFSARVHRRNLIYLYVQVSGTYVCVGGGQIPSNMPTARQGVSQNQFDGKLLATIQDSSIANLV